jgi:DNA-binding transcriptional regulator YiaG
MSKRGVPAMDPSELKDFLRKHKLEKEDYAEIIGVTLPAMDHWLTKRRPIPEPVARITRLVDRKPELMDEL